MLAYSAPLGQRAFLTGGLGAMGFGLPASIGACLAAGGHRTVLVDGDGGFQLNIQELATIRRLGLPIKVFVLDNGGYGSIRSSQRRHFDGRLVGADLSERIVARCRCCRIRPRSSNRPSYESCRTAPNPR